MADDMATDFAADLLDGVNRPVVSKKLILRPPNHPVPQTTEKRIDQVPAASTRESGQPQTPSEGTAKVLRGIDTFRAQVEAFLLDTDRASEESNATLQELEELKAKMQQMRQDNTDLTATVAKQKEDLDDKEANIKAQTEEISSLRSKIAAIESTMMEQTRSSNSMRSRVREYEEDFKQFEGIAGALERVRERKRKRTQV
jgi:chromosome segregation ATPase